MIVSNPFLKKLPCPTSFIEKTKNTYYRRELVEKERGETLEKEYAH